MADTFYGVAVNGTGNVSAVTVDSSTTSSVIELQVTDATAQLTTNKNALLKSLKAIENYIRTASAPA